MKASSFSLTAKGSTDPPWGAAGAAATPAAPLLDPLAWDPLWPLALENVRERFPHLIPAAQCVRCRCDLYDDEFHPCGETDCPLGCVESGFAAVPLGSTHPSGASDTYRPDTVRAWGLTGTAPLDTTNEGV